MDDITFVEEEIGLALRPVFLKDFPIEIAGKTVTQDINIWFANVIGKDSWFAFALTEFPDPDKALSKSDPDSLRKLSTWMGLPWREITQDCAHCVAQQQRDRLHDSDPSIIEGIIDSTVERLEYLRGLGEFQAHAESFERAAGGKLSLN